MKIFTLILLCLTVFDVVAEDKKVVPLEYKDLKKSSFNWDSVSEKEFLSFERWKQETDIKEMTPEWEQTLRAKKNKELVGRFFQCIGKCSIERGEGKFAPNFRSNLYEGDEIKTIGESYAWVYLIDGTMARLSPESSISINEFNLGDVENFFNVRINTGNVLWLSRLENLHEKNNFRETDVLFFPLAFYDASPVTDHKKFDENELVLLTDPKDTTQLQIERLNSLVAENNKISLAKKTLVVLTMPNVTLIGYSPVVEIVALLGGKTYFKQRSVEEQELVAQADLQPSELQYQLRGYENKEITTLNTYDWMVANETGREVSKAEEINLLSMGSFITKRIPSILVARELLFKEYSGFAFLQNYDRNLIAKNEGYRLWEKSEIGARLDFIKEYFRRIETTNLSTSATFTEKMRARGHAIPSPDYTTLFYQKALEKLSIVDPYTDFSEKDKELNSTQKLIWKMKYGIK